MWKRFLLPAVDLLILVDVVLRTRTSPDRRSVSPAYCRMQCTRTLGYTPSDVEIARAHRIVAALAEQPDVGVLQFDGQMINVPHLAQAPQVLVRA